MSGTAGSAAPPPASERFALAYPWHLGPDSPHLQILSSYGFFTWLASIQSESPESVGIVLECLRIYCNGKPGPVENPVNNVPANAFSPQRQLHLSWGSSVTNVSSHPCTPTSRSSFEQSALNGQLHKRPSTRCSTPSNLRQEWRPDSSDEQLNTSILPSSPHPSLDDACGSSAGSAVSQAPSKPKSDKISYICTTGGCKEGDSEGIRSSVTRHEKSHWYRYPCPFCHSQQRKLLQDIGCNCEKPPNSHWLHVEIHRLNIGMYGQKQTKFFMRKDQLELHLQKAHGLSDKESRFLADERKYQIRKTTACGICEGMLFHNPQTMSEHILYHVDKGHTKQMWSDSRVIRNLLTGLDGLREKWKKASKLYGDIHPENFWWEEADALRLRLELEARQLSDSELAEMAVWRVAIPELDHLANGRVSDRSNTGARGSAAATQPGPKARATAGNLASADQNNSSPIVDYPFASDAGPMHTDSGFDYNPAVNPANLVLAQPNPFSDSSYPAMDCTGDTNAKVPIASAFSPSQPPMTSFLDLSNDFASPSAQDDAMIMHNGSQKQAVPALQPDIPRGRRIRQLTDARHGDGGHSQFATQTPPVDSSLQPTHNVVGLRRPRKAKSSVDLSMHNYRV